MRKGMRMLAAAVCVAAMLPFQAFAAEDSGPLPKLFELRDGYDAVEPFENGVAVVYKSGKDGWDWKAGVVDRTGREIVPCIYDDVTVTGYDGFIIATRLGGPEGWEYTYYDLSGNEWTEADEESGDDEPYTVITLKGINVVCGNDKYGLTDAQGKEITGMIYDDIRYYSVSSGTVVALIGDRYGAVELKTGKTVIPFEYDGLFSSEDLGYEASKDGKWGLISTAGAILIPLEYDAIGTFDDCGMAPAYKDGKIGALNAEGEAIIPFQYDTSHIVAEGWSCDDAKQAELEQYNEWMIRSYVSYDLFFDNEVLPLWKGDKMGGVNSRGQTVIPFLYDELECVGDGQNWIAHGEGGYTMFGPEGEKLPALEGKSYEGIVAIWSWGEEDGLRYGYVKNKRMGLMDREGRELTGPVYDFIDDGGHGMFTVLKNGRMGLIDGQGTQIAPAIYDDIMQTPKNGLWGASINGRYTYLDGQGQEMIQRIYDSMDEFAEGLSLVSREGLYGFTDEEGREAVPCVYEDASDFSEGISIVTYQGKKMGVEHPYCRQREINIYVNNGWLYTEEPAYTQDGVAMAAAAELAPAIGAWTYWDEEKDAVYMIGVNRTIEMKIGEKKVVVHDEEQGTADETVLDVPVVTRNGRTFVPIKFAAEAFGRSVEWDAGKNGVMISTDLTDEETL
ncbi:WG repeat-containing protein [Bacilliculturomica massiliensis]|uniref:WG repeat-containing protein n=1 Tax=Bacilliculturomica massiliensis TaxID=1917867 RepID=UPI0010316450|nr:WG repeat-containing protein [Bacilliculturomica massiliensis]